MPNSKLKQAFESGKFVVTAEAGPLKGTDIAELEEVAKILKDKVNHYLQNYLPLAFKISS